MRIFARKKFKFEQGDQTFTVDPLVFTDAPDWIEKDPMFKWAKSDGDIEVISSKKDEKRIENKTKNPQKPQNSTDNEGSQKSDDKKSEE